ncbi:MAG: hypothetical protein ACRDHF_00560 [Tepidiformaceae bacterium]
MSMDGTFVKELAGSLHKPHLLFTDDRVRLVAPAGWQEIERKRPAVVPLVVGTLTGFVGYLQANVDRLSAERLLVHVIGHDTVKLVATLENETEHFRRHEYLRAVVAGPGPGLPWGQFVDAETFFIALQAGFEPTFDRDEVLTLIAGIRERNVRETVDDGVAQKVTVAAGVTLVSEARVPNPVVLKPYRTFREIGQPASSFVLRMRSGKEGEKPQIALFEADGGAWKLEAVQSIVAYLRAASGDLPAPAVIG